MPSDNRKLDPSQSSPAPSTAPIAGDGPPQNPEAELVDLRTTTALGIYLAVLGVVLVYLTVVVWPPDFKVAVDAAGQRSDAKDVQSPIVFLKRSAPVHKASRLQPSTPEPTTNSPTEKTPSRGTPETGQTLREVTVYQLNVSYDRRLLLLVMVIGALGSFIHIVASFGDFVGNRRLTRSWIWWYLLRPYVGMPLAVLFYFVIRAGFLSSGVSAGEVNRFGIAAIAGLVGMFSVKATDKLKELFDTLFKTEAERKDTLANPAPVVQSIKPSKETSGKAFVDVLVTGSSFIPTSVVKVGRVGRDTEFRSSKELSVKLLAQDIAKAGSVSLTVTNPPPGGGVSDPVVLELENPTPVVTKVEPSTDGLKLKIVGSGFSPDSTISVNGAAKSPAEISFVNSAELSVSHRIDPGASNKVDIEISNPKPGGGTSGKKSFDLPPR